MPSLPMLSRGNFEHNFDGLGPYLLENLTYGMQKDG